MTARCHYLLTTEGGDLIYALALAVALLAMGHEDYDTREWGSRTAGKLVRLDPARFGPFVAGAASLNPCAEIRSRCSRLTGPYNAHLSTSYVPIGVPCWPEIDVMCWAGIIDCAEMMHWLGKAATPMGTPDAGPWWNRYRRATELLTRDMIRLGRWSCERADALLAVAWKAEIEWFKRNRPEMLATVESWKWTDGFPRP